MHEVVIEEEEEEFTSPFTQISSVQKLICPGISDSWLIFMQIFYTNVTDNK
jgi:hypothetical protein